MSQAEKPRRRFVAQLGAAIAAVTGGAAFARAQGTGHTHSAPAQQRHETPHDEWMKKLTGHHRQLFHGVTYNEIPNLMAKNYLDAYAGPYGMRAEHVNAVIGVHGSALGLVFNDALWKKYELGRKFAVNDPATSQPLERNVHAAGSDLGVAELQRRGVLYLACETGMRLSAARWAAAANQTPEATFEDLKANLLPGVIPVPAMVVAINRAQEAGLTYVRAS